MPIGGVAAYKIQIGENDNTKQTGFTTNCITSAYNALVMADFDVSQVVNNASALGMSMNKADANKVNELVFCYKGIAMSFYNISRASFMKWLSGTSPSNGELGVDGYCKLDNSNNFFTRGRKAVMTQVMIKVNIDSSSVLGMGRAFEYMQRGTDAEAAKN